MAILNNILWIILAYLIGSFNFSIILTKYNSKREDIKKVGSGNAGATNAMRIYGIKFGLLVFFLDTSKCYWLGFILGLLQSKVGAFNDLIPQMILLFVIIGHIFPLYFKFKGGKGAATMLGMISSISIFLAIIGTIMFLLVVSFTKYVSLGSISIPYVLAAFAFFLPNFNYIDTTISYGPFWVSPVCLFIGSIIVAISHWQNIIRLINGNESKISFKKYSKKNIEKKEKKDLENYVSNENQTSEKAIDYLNKNKSIIDEALNKKFD